MNNFDDIADNYDRFMTGTMTPERLDFEVSELVGLDFPKGPMIDLGCGSGIQCHYYRQRFPEISEIVGLDTSAQMIEIAKQRHAGKNITYVQGDFHDTPFDDESFAFIHSRFATHYSADMPKAMHEIARIAQQGAYIFVHVVHPLFELFNKPSRDYRKQEEATFRPLATSDIHFEHMTHTIEEYMNSLVGAGLTLESMTERYGPRSGEKEYRIPTVLLMRIRKPARS